jgi:hypothetical protein
MKSPYLFLYFTSETIERILVKLGVESLRLNVTGGIYFGLYRFSMFRILYLFQI